MCRGDQMTMVVAPLIKLIANQRFVPQAGSKIGVAGEFREGNAVVHWHVDDRRWAEPVVLPAALRMALTLGVSLVLWWGIAETLRLAIRAF